jgi:hypothetical protein
MTRLTKGPGDSATAISPDVSSARLALLLELEASLRQSQRALLSRDIETFEELTRKQELLAHTFNALSEKDRLPSDSISAAARRVLQLGRIQIALLGRAHSSLRLVANLLTGAGSDYSSSLSYRIGGTPEQKKELGF